jgi:hypothetical protein
LYYNNGGLEDAEVKTSAGMESPWGAEGTNEARLYSLYAVFDTAAFQGMMGDSGFADGNLSTEDCERSWYYTLPSKAYTAIAGDSVVEVCFWADPGATADSVELAVYEFDHVGDTPTVIVGIDTMAVGSASQWYCLTVSWALEAGKSYSVAMAKIDCDAADWFFHKGSSTNSYGDSSATIRYEDGDILEDPYSSTSKTADAAHYMLFARVENTPPEGVNSGTILNPSIPGGKILKSRILGSKDSDEWYGFEMRNGVFGWYLQEPIEIWLGPTKDSVETVGVMK